MYVKTQTLFAEGEVLRVTLLVPGNGEGALECRARVVWVNQGFPRPKLQMPQGAGMAFLHAGQSLTLALRKVIEREKESQGTY